MHGALRVKFWKNIFFNRDMSLVFTSHVSAHTHQQKLPGKKFFLIHPRNWNIFFFFFWGFAVCCLVLAGEKSLHIENKKYDGKKVFL